MASLIVAVAASLAAGFIVWGADRRRSSYGIFLLSGVGAVTGLLLWVVLQLAGAGSDPDLHWLVWALPPVAAAVGTVTTALVLGPARQARDTAELERVLRL